LTYNENTTAFQLRCRYSELTMEISSAQPILLSYCCEELDDGLKDDAEIAQCLNTAQAYFVECSMLAVEILALGGTAERLEILPTMTTAVLPDNPSYQYIECLVSILRRNARQTK
jgi:hypothetical protein